MAQDLQLAAHKSRKLEKTVSSKYLVTARLQLGMQNRLETAIVAKCYLTTVDTLHAVVCSTSCWLAGLGLRPNFPFSLRGQQIILQERFSTNCYVRKAREPAGYEHGYLHSFLLLKRGFSTKPTMTTRMQMDLFWTDGAKK